MPICTAVHSSRFDPKVPHVSVFCLRLYLRLEGVAANFPPVMLELPLVPVQSLNRTLTRTRACVLYFMVVVARNFAPNRLL